MIEGWNKKVLLKDKGLKWKILYSSNFEGERESDKIHGLFSGEEKQMFSNSFTFYLSKH
jgi:hypothetical protein